ncbi:MAG: Asp-tRNA(Asn)/Glu-tRNA(Gln) amidotransferase subunit GatC [Desulfobacterales bacterium]
MKITKEEVVHVAKLARLDIEEDLIDKFAAQIGSILAYIDVLNTVDTEGVTPTSHAIFLNNAFREDDPGNHLQRDAALANAPEKEDGWFLVPKVIG